MNFNAHQVSAFHWPGTATQTRTARTIRTNWTTVLEFSASLNNFDVPSLQNVYPMGGFVMENMTVA